MQNIITQIYQWFNIAKPTPTIKDFHTQLGAHVEEFTELFEEGLDFTSADPVIQDLKLVKDYYYAESPDPDFEKEINKVAVLDSICDQIVTGVGLAYMLGMDIEGALKEVAASNDSKYYFVGYTLELTPQQLGELANICMEIESQGRYEGVHWKRQGKWVVFFSNTGKILKNPRTYFEPDLTKFTGESYV